MPLWTFFFNKNNFYKILQTYSSPHTSGLGVGFAVIAVYKQVFGGEWDYFLLRHRE